MDLQHSESDASFQIISDLHLETPVQIPSYTFFSSPFNFPILANHLLLLGDIGLISQTEPLLSFLNFLLSQNTDLKIFYIMGNHEPYHMTLETGIKTMQQWESNLNLEFGPRFHFLNRRRIDLNPTTTLLGCTLWTHVPTQHAHAVATSIKDLSTETGIHDRTLHDHNADHAQDLAWLNAQVQSIELSEPQREIIVLTHHSPTTDPRGNSKRFPPDRPLNSAFRTDLSAEKCWESARVKVWAFGHTHFSCQFVDKGDRGEGQSDREERRKLVVANQKGYAYPEGQGNWEIEPVVVGRVEGRWRVVVGERGEEG